MPPESAHIETVAQELGVGMATLERWRAEALGAPRTERTWTAAARWEAVIATAALDEVAKSAWCREQGLYSSDLTAWRDQAMAALATPAEARARPEETRKDRRRIQELEREMRRKDKALAETAALRVASKKLSAIRARARTNDSAERSPNPGPEYPASAGCGGLPARRLGARGY